MILKACGITTNFRTWLGVKPIEAAASFWPLLTPWTPALTHSAIKVAVYKDKANAKEINSGGNFRPPLKVKDVLTKVDTKNLNIKDFIRIKIGE